MAVAVGGSAVVAASVGVCVGVAAVGPFELLLPQALRKVTQRTNTASARPREKPRRNDRMTHTPNPNTRPAVSGHARLRVAQPLRARHYRPITFFCNPVCYPAHTGNCPILGSLAESIKD